jgi:hypothetical protein
LKPQSPDVSNAPISPSTGFYNTGINELGLGVFWDKSTTSPVANPSGGSPMLNATPAPGNNK